MNLIIRFYLAGVFLNLLVIFYQIYKDFGVIDIDFKRSCVFILSSWIVYPIIYIQNKTY